MDSEGRSTVLPSVPLPSDQVEVAGQMIVIRSLSRADALKLTTQFTDNPDGAEIFVISKGVGVSEEEARDWRDNTDPNTAGKVIDGIILLTGLGSTSKS